MKTLIFFREGLSGHYLKSIITDCASDIGFRVDPWYPKIYEGPKIDNEQESCLCRHPHLVGNNFDLAQFDLILTIQVYEKIYHACYNNFYKKYLIENPREKDKLKTWITDPVHWYDLTFYNIKEYFALYTSDRESNSFSNIVNFDRLLDADYIENILQTYFNCGMTDNRHRIVQTYKALQLQHHLPCRSQSMKEITADLPDQIFLESPWFASYCIFCFETNNNLQEHQRDWSIDDLLGPMDRKFLIELEEKYHS